MPDKEKLKLLGTFFGKNLYIATEDKTVIKKATKQLKTLTIF